MQARARQKRTHSESCGLVCRGWPCPPLRVMALRMGYNESRSGSCNKLGLEVANRACKTRGQCVAVEEMRRLTARCQMASCHAATAGATYSTKPPGGTVSDCQSRWARCVRMPCSRVSIGPTQWAASARRRRAPRRTARLLRQRGHSTLVSERSERGEPPLLHDGADACLTAWLPTLPQSHQVDINCSGSVPNGQESWDGCRVMNVSRQDIRNVSNEIGVKMSQLRPSPRTGFPCLVISVTKGATLGCIRHPHASP